MSYDAGSIVASADLDRTPFQQGLRLLRQEARDLERTKVTPSADLDTTKADPKIADFKTRLERIAATKATAQVAIENGQAVRALIDTSDRLDKLRATVATARADVDDQKAKDKLDALDLQLRRVGLITSRPRVTLDGVRRANLQLDALALKLAAVDRAGSGGGGGRGGLTGGSGPGFFGSLASHAPSFLGLGLGAAVPAALPIAALGVGAGASLLTPLASGLAGIVPFAAAASASIKIVSADVKKLTGLQAQYNAATTNKQRAAILAKEHALWSSLDPAQRKAVKNVQELDDSWKRFQKAVQPQTFGALAAGVGIVNTLLKDARPVTRAVGDEIINLEKSAHQAFQDPFWTNFFTKFLAREAPRAIDTLGVSAGHFFTGLAHLTRDFAPLGHDFEAMLVRWSTRFEHWTEGQGPGKFVAWVEKNGPGAAHALEGLAHGVEGLGKGLFPIGQVELKAMTPILNFIGKLGDEHPAVITAVGTALLGVGAGLKVIAGVKGITTVLGGIRGLRGGGGIGGVGGAISKEAPVPVYVTNWGGGPGGVPGGGKEPVPTGTPSRLSNLKKILPAPTLLLGAYLATQGGDQAPGQTPLGSSRLRNGPAITSLIAGVGPRIPMNQGQDFFSGDPSSPGGRPVNPSALVNNTLAYGTAAQVAQLKELARTYPAISTALRDYNKQQSALNKLLVVNPGLAKNVAAANKQVGSSFAGVVNTLAKLGPRYRAQARLLGGDLGQGLIQGIQAQIPHATVAGKILVSQTAKAMRLAAEANSPSRLTARLGRDLADGLAVGFKDRMPTVVAKFKAETSGVLSTLAAVLVQAQTDLQNRVAGARSQLSSDLGARRGVVSGITGGLYGAANIGNAYVNGRVANIGGFLGSIARPEERLVRDLRRLRKLHLSGRLQAEIAGTQDPNEALALAQNILSGKSGSVAHLNALDREIHGFAHQIGVGVGGALYDTRITGDRAKVDEMVGALHQLNRNIDDVKRILKDNPRDFADALDAAVRGVHHRHQSRTSH